MGDTITFTIDGKTVEARAGETILEAADRAGIYIPRLCYMKGLPVQGRCRVCTVKVNGRAQAACVQPATPNAIIENDTPEMREHRRSILDMLFVEGNHFCMFCEKSGNCELQALAYRHGITAPRYAQMYPDRHVDASHPDILVDHNRCVLCGRCVAASRTVDGKSVFEFVNRGPHRRVGVNSALGLGGTNMALVDKAAEVCPVGAILKKRTGYAVPIGQRQYDHEPIGADIEKRRT